MFSSLSTRGRLRRSMSTRSIRRPRRPPTETNKADLDLSKHYAAAAAAAAASHAMHSSQLRSQQSSAELKCSYGRVGGLAQVAIPRRRPKSSLQYTDDSLSTCGVPTVPPSTPRPSTEAGAMNTIEAHENSAVLPPTVELNGLDGRDSSIPSSYRRLRKAKSMFSTRQRPSIVPYSTPPCPRRDAMDIERSPQFVLPRTMRHTPSFTGSSPFQGSHEMRHAKSQDTAIQLARNQFLRGNEGVPQPRRSSFHLNRRKRENKQFRKTFRATSESSIGAKIQVGGTHGRRRTFSASFKNGIKRVFGLSKSVEQQPKSPVERNPPRSPVVTVGDEDHDKELINQYTEVGDSLPSSPLRVPQISPSHTSLCTSKSRVTSWADSTVANTVTTRKAGHRQSLSLIEEHGDLNHQFPESPSDAVDPSLPTPRKSAARRFNDWVDSHDLYSALMQQIGRQAVQSPEEDIVFGNVPEHRVVPERTPSALSRRSKRTIRHVPSVDSSTPGSFITARAGGSSSPGKHVIRPLQYVPPLKTTRRVPEQENQPPGPVFDDSSLRQPYRRGEDSDDETGSVIVFRYGGPDTRAVSPSIYSRTTDGGTPSKGSVKPQYAAEEPGTATIFAPQRAVYVSPKRSSSSSPLRAQVKPSMDWQKWMSSEIERIEATSLPREHVREDAQFQDDDEDQIFMGKMRRAPGPRQESIAVPYIFDDPKNDSQTIEEFNSTPQSNFSRPFNRSSSVRTILPSQKIEPIRTIKTAPSPLVADTTVDAASPTPIRVPSDQTLSPMRTRVANLPVLPDSPTPRGLMPDRSKRILTQEQYRRYSARRPMANGRPNSFRSMRACRDSNALNNENLQQGEDQENLIDEFQKLQSGYSTVSSKHMVEMFLNSRRRPAEADVSNDNYKPSGDAFV